jgi:hypothetical protein
VQDGAGERIELADPWRALDHCLGMRIAGTPPPQDAGWAEIDVLGVVSPSSRVASSRTTCMRVWHP